MSDLSAETGFFMQKESPLARLVRKGAALRPPYLEVRDRLVKLGEEYGARLNKMSGEYAGGGKDPLIRLTLLLDSGDRRVRQALLECEGDLFQDLDFLAKEAAEAVKKKDSDAIEQLSALYAGDYTAVSQQARAIISYINAADGDYMKSTDDRHIKMLADCLENKTKAQKNLDEKITKLKNRLDTGGLHELHLLLALSQMLKHLD